MPDSEEIEVPDTDNTADVVKDFFLFFKRALIGILILQGINSGIDTWTEWNRREQSQNIAESLDIIRKATSEETRAEQGEVINQLVLRIDCNNRVALEEVLDQLDLSVTLVEENCVQD